MNTVGVKFEKAYFISQLSLWVMNHETHSKYNSNRFLIMPKPSFQRLSQALLEVLAFMLPFMQRMLKSSSKCISQILLAGDVKTSNASALFTTFIPDDKVVSRQL